MNEANNVSGRRRSRAHRLGGEEVNFRCIVHGWTNHQYMCPICSGYQTSSAANATLQDVYRTEIERLRAENEGLNISITTCMKLYSDKVNELCNLKALLREARPFLPNPSFSEDCLFKRIDAALGEKE